MIILRILLKSFFLTFLVVLFSSCSWLFTDHKYDYLIEETLDPLKIPTDKSARQVIDFYSVPEDEDQSFNANVYEVPLPEQFFSSGSSNEIRLHKLGELRWLYVESLPSSVWPLMKQFWSGSEYGIEVEDPNLGVIETRPIEFEGNVSKFRVKVEHGIRSASSEVFISHLQQADAESWVRVDSDKNLEDSVLRAVLNFLSQSSSSQGTSLVALNLNLGQKAILKQDTSGSSYIEMNLEFPRAWAAVDRALKEAVISVKDLDRKNGVFYVAFSQKEEKGFFGRLLDFNQSDAEQNFKIFVIVEGSKCIVKVEGDNPESLFYERELLSQINQSLS